MAKLQKLQCDNCGGKIDGSTLVCQSCGMQFRLDDGPNGFTLGRVEVYHGKFHLIQGHVSVPAYALKEPEDFERAAEWTLTDMSKRMAELKRTLSNTRYAIGNIYMSKRIAATKRIASDTRYTIGNSD